MRADPITDTSNMAAWARGRAGVTSLEGLIHHTDAGSQDNSIAFTERLAALGIRASIGTLGDAYDNALAECTIGLSEAELIRCRRALDDAGRRDGDPGVGRLVQQPPPAHRARRHPPAEHEAT